MAWAQAAQRGAVRVQRRQSVGPCAGERRACASVTSSSGAEQRGQRGREAEQASQNVRPLL
jgi:hypothetical protein